MAVVRLVNGIVDVSRTGKTGSILARAQSAEWPQLFVDLRHEASHQNLPALPILRLAAQEAVWLLVERFWRPQLQKIEERGRTDKAQMADRGAKTLDRRLKALIWCTTATGMASEGPLRKRRKGSKAKLGEDQDGETAREPEAAAKRVAEDLSGMAADESKLLARIFQVLERDPHADGREARAIHLLCQTCSENFALRFLRQLLFAAAGLPTVKLEGAADNCPSLRNISDRCCGGARELDVKDHSMEDSERMLQWLWALLSADAPDKDTGSSSRFRCALVSLLPSLRLAAMGHMASSAGPDIASRSSRLWAALREERLDAGAEMFSAMCEALDPSSGLGSAVPAHQGPSTGLETLEAFVKQSQSENGARPGRAEPWTAVGTVLDRNLSISCREEHPEKMPLSAEAQQKWLDWAAEDFYANSDDKEVIREGGREIGVPIEDSLDDPADSGVLVETSLLPEIPGKLDTKELQPMNPDPVADSERTAVPQVQAEDVEVEAQELAAEPITADEFRQLAAEVLALAAGHSSQAT
ncbi:las1 [Symbiodinium natans]|uniref:Las1 protein n=1 Tax=Symbiodinium natans TaxID=878477 RepID=A0A812NKK7_9DINO|nr:las1 [Symbiodinium natans]